MNKIINWNIEKQLDPIINVEPYEYMKVIKYLSDYFSNYDYYKKLIKELKNIDGDELKQSVLHDKVIREYIKCRPGIGIIVLFPKATDKKDKLKDCLDLLKNNGHIYYQKEIKINYKMMYNLIFQQYINTFRMKSNSNIIYKVNRLGLKPYLDDNKTIRIIVFEPNKDVKLFGSSVDFKTNLRNIFLETDLKETNYDSTDDRYPRGHDYLHINDTFNEAIEYADIFFNENSLNFLRRQACWRFISFYNSQKEIYNLKKILFNLPIVEQYRFLITSSAILSLYGVRELNDIDLLLMDDPKIGENTLNKILKIYDISYKFSKDWTAYWEKELNDRIKLFTDYANYNEFILDPNNCFYFSGLRFLRLKYEIPIRAIRKGRPAQFADLLMMKRLLNLNYQLEIPKETRREVEKDKFDYVPVTDIDGYIKTVRYYILKRYNIDISFDNVKKWIFSKENKINYEGGSGEFYFKINSIVNDKMIYPSDDQLEKMGYNLFLRYLSDTKPYILEGEEWNHFNNKNCNRETHYKILDKNNNILRVCTFNVHQFVSRCNQGDNPLFGENLNMFEMPRNINKFINLFKEIDADVLCLQEVVPISKDQILLDLVDNKDVRKLNFDYLNELMSKIGYKYKVIYSTNYGNFTKNESHDYYFNANAIYSKFEFLNESAFELFINRNISFIDIKFKNKNITIGNTHLLPHEYESDKIPKETNIIVKQNEVINEIIEKNIKNENLILCGDFNLNIYENTNKMNKWNEKTKPIRDNFNNTMKKTYTTNFNNDLQTDFILLNKKANIKTLAAFVINTNISDHNPVIANFVL